MSAVTGDSAKNQTTNQVSQTTFRPEDQAAILNQQRVYNDWVNGYQRLGNNSANMSEANQVNLGTGFRGAGLNTEFQGFQGSQGLDTTSKNLISSELGNRQAAQQRQQQNIMQQFAGRNPGLARVLQAQNAAQGQLANNPLAFQAFQQQGGREMQAYGLNQQAQLNTNQARLAQQEQANQALGMGNQAQLQQQQGNLGALQQAFGQRQGLLGNQQSLMQALGQLAQGYGTNISNTSQQQNQDATQGALVDHLRQGGTIGKIAGPATGISNTNAAGYTFGGPIYAAGHTNPTKG